MPDIDADISIRIEVMNPQRQFLGGTVDIEFKPQESGQTMNVKGADASKDIDVGGLQRTPQGLYQVTVTPTDVFKPTSQFVTIPASGFNTVQFIIDKGTGGHTGPPNPDQNSLQGSLVFDHGLPAAGIAVRLFHVGFGGKDAQLGEVKTDAQGNYSIPYGFAKGALANLQVRVLDSTNKEVTISKTKFNAGPSETLNLVVPATVQPLAPEFQRFSSDMQKSIGGVSNLGQAQEGAARQDLTLLNQSTNWDARVVALAATAAQHAATTGLGPDVLYSLFRVGLPTDPALLAMVPSDTVQKVLTKSSGAGIVSMNDKEIAAATTAFQNFSSKTLLSMAIPGAVSSFSEMVTAALPNTAQQAAFTSLYFKDPMASDFWSHAANLKIPAETLDTLKLQGKFLYLTFNSAPLAQKLQKDVGSLTSISKVVDKDYDSSTTWQKTLTDLAGTGGDQALQKLIPAAYSGKTTADRLAAYSGDLARKVRFSFPTEVAARMIDRKELPLSEKTAPNVSAFLRAAAPLGYSLGQTPLNAFLNKSGKNLPQLDADSKESLKSLHRLYQVTPSSESLQAAMKLGFTSARDIAFYSKEEFINRYAFAFPEGEAAWVYGRSQTVSSVTFNIFSSAKQLDNSPPVYGMSGSSDARQQAKNSLVQQFPSMASLFGNLDYCQCEDCRSVLSPAAYFVDILEFLNGSAANAAGNTPLDVLIGSAKVPGRRPDLGALPLTCENTNTAMPYIDLVNEILEYFIAHNQLDASLAYDTGSATTADLTAEPQNILPDVYSKTLRQAMFPPQLPFDLWIETVRGFLNYFKSPLAQVLDTLRPADNLELFTDANAYPYYRAQILAEALGLSPAEYEILTVSDAALQPLLTNWFKLYGYPDENTALNGAGDKPPLSSAKNLAQLLSLTYQELTDLLTTGFLNPALYPLIAQLERFGINIADAFSFTNQPGYPAFTAQQTTDFGTFLDGITAQYKSKNSSSTFDARTWLTNLLPANYTKKVLVLFDPNTGCNFGGTTLLYADNSATSAATPLDFVKFNLFVRLWKKLGWTLDETDRALQLFFPGNLPAWADANFTPAFSAAWKTALVYLAHLDDLNTRLAPAMGRVALLPFWSNLPVVGENSLYAQLFLTSSVLNSDEAFDDPNGLFPTPASDFPAPPPFPPLTTFSAHQAVVEGVLGLTADEITAIFQDAGAAVTTVSFVENGQTLTVPGFTLTNLSICYRYSTLAKCLQMDVLDVLDMIALKLMSGLDPFHALSGTPLSILANDFPFTQTLLFVNQAVAVQDSGFTVEDLKYLLRQQFDPVGVYKTDPNDLTALVQSVANGLQQIQAQNAVPLNLMSMAESLIDQTLSSLFPAGILKTLFALLANSQTYTAKATFATAIDPTPFAQETRLSFSFDTPTTTETIGYEGLLLDWKKAELKAINPAISGMLDAVQLNAQKALAGSVSDMLGVWASLAQYEAVKTPVLVPINATPLMQVDPALTLSYDQTDTLQWLGYRGVLTDAKQTALLAVNNSADMQQLLTDIQTKTKPAYIQLVSDVLGMWTNVQTYQTTQSPVTPANQVDVNAFFAALTAAQQAGTITDPVPQLQFTYDAGSQVQTLACQGVLTASMEGKLVALIASPVLSLLLADVRTQVTQVFQFLTPGLLTVPPGDLDTCAQPFIGLDFSKQQKRVKATLVSVFLPLLAQKLSRQLILQTLAANLGADASLIEALATDAALLTDPSNPGKSLLGAFLSLGQQGVSATYFDGVGNVIATGTPGTPDTASQPTAVGAHFEGYLQVPTDGPYRFFAELGNTGAAARLQLNPPDPTALLNNPIIPPVPPAAKDHDEVSQFAQLKGGALYHFTLDFSNLGANGASLQVQGENMAKGPLSQILLYPQQSISGFTRAKTLLAKVLQILRVTALDEREISYLVANSAQFSNLRLSSMPTQPSDDTPANAIALFSQILALMDYADLRKGPAGGSDGLIDVFQNVGMKFTEPASSPDTNKNAATPWTAFANPTRRDAATVRAIAEYFGFIKDQVVGPNRELTGQGDFGNNKGIRRIWQALQLQQIVGIPAPALIASTVIASAAPPAPDLIAASFKNAVKAQYTADSWRPIAQSVFDKLRQKKRDALVAFLVDHLKLENSNQLFEYFLVDPGMEPVVQTSRLRLAMSSVQTFIQRCLLNLENGNIDPAVNVSPSVIDADWWSWMKRYRVWQANREIFLFPENWMIPELRLDKTDLFQTLESALLQGDVTSDLADDAFLTYLKALEVRARLDIVATYLDQNLTDGSFSTLHVLGRTYGHPHKYFYRTYSSATWSGWETVTPDIDGNHIALAIWKGRLNLFWVTFIPLTKNPPQPGADSGGTHVSDLSFGELAGKVFSATPQAQMQVQLHWSEYFQGKWSNPIASDINRYLPVDVQAGFDPSMVYIRISKEGDANVGEGPVKVHLDFPASLITDERFFFAELIAFFFGGPLPQPNYSFRITSKNCDLELNPDFFDPTPPIPYDAAGIDATLHTGSGNLTSQFQSAIGDSGTSTTDTEPILQTVNGFALLTCANPVSPSPFLVSEPFLDEAGRLVSPFFYKDSADINTSDELTFFVQPNLTEKTIVEWDWWAVGPPVPPPVWTNPSFYNNINVIAQVPVAGPVPINPGDPVYSVFPMQNATDWLTAPGTVVSYGGAVIGKSGGISAGNIATRIGGAVTSTMPGMLGTGAGRGVTTGLTLVGAQGLTASQAQTITKTAQATSLRPNLSALVNGRTF